MSTFQNPISHVEYVQSNQMAHPSKAFHQLHSYSLTDQIILCHKDRKTIDHKAKQIYHYY